MGLSSPLPRSDTHHFLLHIMAHINHVDLPTCSGYSEEEQKEYRTFLNLLYFSVTQKML